MPWTSDDARASIGKQIGNTASLWDARVRNTGDPSEARVRRILDAVARAVENGDDDTLNRLDAIARTTVDGRRQELEKLRWHVSQWFATRGAIADAARYCVLHILGTTELRAMLVSEYGAPVSMIDPKVDVMVNALVLIWTKMRRPIDPENAIARAMMTFGMPKTRAYGLFSWKAKRVVRRAQRTR